MSEEAARDRKYVVYLLHFHGPPSVNAHYVGISTPTRLLARMREHAAGRGSKATSAACRLGLTWCLARTFETRNRRLETRLQQHPGLDALCPVCRGQSPIQEYRPTKNAATREWPHSTRVLTEALSFGKRSPLSGDEKGGEAEALPLFPSHRQATCTAVRAR